ncbi:DUF4365 domain-containing protein [Chitinophaga sp. ARDCPP14]|uniref:DUF4365 domain-containing protein n=1 Tax=Chitinophaga sp. ARDCPP14 TaxID=3391139 RepID=UPI003F51D37B
MPLSSLNVESELSYAYLHAVASKAGMNCKVENRHGDNYGTDALVDYFAPIPNTYRTDVSLRIQLKATTNIQSETSTHFSYSFRGIDQYDKLRSNRGEPHRLLVVLLLPNSDNEWLSCSIDELILRNAAYWICLYNAPASTNQVSQTIYIPKTNLLTPDSLVAICQEIGQGNIPTYTVPS